MPTGYTYSIEEETDFTFKEFALGCARAFSPLISMRDLPADAPIPETLYPSARYTEAIQRAAKEVERFDSMTQEECKVIMEEEAALISGAYTSYEVNLLERHRRYAKMLKQVDAWTPPTPEHTGLKEFMQQQIKASDNFGEPKSTLPKFAISAQNVEEYLAERKAVAAASFDHATKEYKKEVEAIHSRNLWVKDLRESLEKS